MSHTIHHSQCPVCNTVLVQGIALKDFSVSQQDFTLALCPQCGFQLTQDMPDAETIGPYYKSEDYISHTNTSKGLINSLYQKVRKRTLKQKRRLVSKMTGLEKGTLADIGSGIGAFAHEMQTHGWQVTGMEPDSDARKLAADLFKLNLQTPDHLYRLAPESVDAITLWHVLEHVHDLNGYVEQFRKALKPGGRLFIAVPNYTSGDAKAYGQHWAAYDVPRHLWHFSPESMKQLLEKHGLQLLALQPMWFDSFYVSMLSSKYKNGKTSLAGAFFTGLRSNLKAWGHTGRCSSVIYIAGR